MGLFGNKDDKRAKEMEAQAEVERLIALPVPRLAAEILPAFGPDGPGKDGKEIGTFQVAMYLLADLPHSGKLFKELLRPIREGFQALENGGLIERRMRHNGGPTVSVTRLGVEAIETGTVDDHLKV